MYNEWFAETVQKNGMNAVIIDNKSIDELVTEVLKLW